MLLWISDTLSRAADPGGVDPDPDFRCVQKKTRIRIRAFSFKIICPSFWNLFYSFYLKFRQIINNYCCCLIRNALFLLLFLSVCPSLLCTLKVCPCCYTNWFCLEARLVSLRFDWTYNEVGNWKDLLYNTVGYLTFSSFQDRGFLYSYFLDFTIQ